MRKYFKYVANKIGRPLATKYISKVRHYSFNDITLAISPGVFHPGLFFSTKFLLKYILTLNLFDKKFLELGAGSGLIAFNAAKKGANVTATDINSIAIEYLKKNKTTNQANLTIIESDLFKKIPLQQFDIIAINPPYYKKVPVTEADYAWYCGENGEYFDSLFQSLSSYSDNTSLILMVISDDSDLVMIRDKAMGNNYELIPLKTRWRLFERHFIYQIVQKTAY